MKKIVLVLGLLLFVVNLNAGGKLLFDLTAQHFSNTIVKDNKCKRGGRYELPNAYVSTDTCYENGNYDKGVFSVRLKKPLPQNWRVNATVYHSYDSNNIIKASTSSGKSFVVSILRYKITINDQVFKIKQDLNYKFLDVSISSISGNVEVRINGQRFYKTKTNPSDKFQIAEVSSKNEDRLSRLEIFSVD